MDPAKVEAITKWPRPTSVTEVRSFPYLITGYYRRFVDGFSRLALPLTKLMRKGEKFVWNDEREKSFEELKQRLVSAPILTPPHVQLDFRFISVLSKKGLGLCTHSKHGKIKAAQKDDGEIWAIIQNLDKQTEFHVDSDGILWQGTKLCVPEGYLTSRGFDDRGSKFSFLFIRVRRRCIMISSNTSGGVDQISMISFSMFYHDLEEARLYLGCRDRWTKTAHFLPIRKGFFSSVDWQRCSSKKSYRLQRTLGEPGSSSVRFHPETDGKSNERFRPGGHVYDHIIREDLSYTEEPESILDRQVRVMRNKTIPFVKILWRNHPEREATWETEESIRTSYPSVYIP
ncbi:retrotransposon protein, putative, ty3-gypsy subclass [Tanacetum coccineum]